LETFTKIGRGDWNVDQFRAACNSAFNGDAPETVYVIRETGLALRMRGVYNLKLVRCGMKIISFSFA